MPLDESAVGLDHLEDVGAAACEGHGCRLLVRGLGFLREAVWGVRCKNLLVQIQIDWEMRSRLKGRQVKKGGGPKKEEQARQPSAVLVTRPKMLIQMTTTVPVPLTKKSNESKRVR